MTKEFFDTQNFPLSIDSGTKATIPSHEIKLDHNQKPKNFYRLVVHFKQGKISMDKVYGDFKRLHNHIRETLETEIKEWDHYLATGDKTEVEISSLAE